MIRTFENVSPVIEPSAWVDETALVIGDVVLGAESSVWPMSVLRGDVNTIRVGARTNIQDGCVLHVTHASERTDGGRALEIGDDVTVGHKVILHACTVGNRVLVGMGAIVMDGAIVEDDVILGAGALVTPGKHLKSGGLYVGSPARRVRSLGEQEREYLAYSAAHYVRLMERHRGRD